jgi:hypothetical protein
MFNKDFFPTPKAVISKMLDGLYNITSSKYYKILDPSSGKGDILDYIKGINTENNNNLRAIEIEPELSSILMSKGYNVIDTDFLTYNCETSYDLIVMNPPFSEGVKHLIKAIEISKDKGTVIRCLINTNNLINDYSQERKLLLHYLDIYKADIEHLGQVFKNSERPTNVEVSLIKIKMSNKESSFKFNFSNVKEHIEKIQGFSFAELADNDLAQSFVDMYEKTKAVYQEFLTKKSELEFYLKEMNMGCDLRQFDSLSLDSNYEKFVEKLRDRSWDKVINKSNISGMVTQKVSSDIEKLKDKQGFVSFTVNNIRNLILSLKQNIGSILKDCVVDSFDLMTKYHDENRVHIEGWKTNLFWKVGKRVILPYCKDRYSYNNSVKAINDIEKALCVLSNIDFERINGVNQTGSNYGELADSHFFTFRRYKKGTIHLTFKDLQLLKDFNFMACSNKAWLGGRCYTDNEEKYTQAELLALESKFKNEVIQGSINLESSIKDDIKENLLLLN